MEAVKKKPGMYICNTCFSALHHLFWEIVDNSINEVLVDFWDLVIVIINCDNTIKVSDNGCGILIDIVKNRFIRCWNCNIVYHYW